MKRIMLIAAIACMALVSCTKEELEPNANEGAIGFSAFTGRQVNNTKAVTTLESLKAANGFGLIASYTGTADFSASSTPNFMYNQQVTFSEPSWNYSPIKYWPSNFATEKISFFAWAPFGATGATLSDNEKAGYPTITFAQSLISKDQVDLVGTAVMNRTNDRNTVSLPFKHLLSRMGFSAKVSYVNASDEAADNHDGYTYVFVKEANISSVSNAYLNGIFTYDGSDNIGSWAGTTGEAKAITITGSLNAILESIDGTTYSSTSVKLANDGTTATNLFGTNEFMYFIPGSAAAISVVFTYDVVTIDSKVNGGCSVVPCTRTVTVAAPSTPLQPGKAYRYIFSIGLDAIEVSATVEEDWGTEE